MLDRQHRRHLTVVGLGTVLHDKAVTGKPYLVAVMLHAAQFALLKKSVG